MPIEDTNQKNEESECRVLILHQYCRLRKVSLNTTRGLRARVRPSITHANKKRGSVSWDQQRASSTRSSKMIQQSTIGEHER